MVHNTHNHTKRYTFCNNSIYHWHEIKTREPKAGCAALGLIVISIFFPLLNASLPRTILNGLEEKWEMGRYVGMVLCLILMIAVANMLQEALRAYMRRMQGPFEDEYNLQLLKKRLQVDYETLESQEFTEDANAVFDSLYRANSVVRDSFWIWQRFLTAAGSVLIYGIILLRQNWLVLALVLLPAFVSFLLKRRANNQEYALRPVAEKAVLKMRYAARMGLDQRAGKDIRMYNLCGWLLDILHSERDKGESNVRRWEKGYFGVNLGDAVFCFIRDLGAYIYFIVQIIQGNMPVSDFVWYTSVVANSQQACDILLETVELLGKWSLDYSRLRHFFDSYGNELVSATLGNNENQGQTEADPPAIELEHVYFAYQNGEKPVLQDLNVSIHKGEKIALVGVNGAGKSTLVKLLCGLYRPTSGVIRVNGKDISSYRKEEYYALLAAVFQDVKLLPLTIAQNVASQNSDMFDRERVRECLSLAGLLEMVDNLPAREDTPLGWGVLDNGIGLSGGQQQKVWMARAFYKNAPILILDEPTAALDPIAEQEIYQKYDQISAGKTSVFISHRLSSTRFCDQIWLLENGRITERGTHEELMDRKGAYAELFLLQSKYYQKEVQR